MQELSLQDNIDIENHETKQRHEGFAIIIGEFVKYRFDDVTKKNKNVNTAMHLAAITGSMTLLAAFATLEKIGSKLSPNKDSKNFYTRNLAGETPLDIIILVTLQPY